MAVNFRQNVSLMLTLAQMTSTALSQEVEALLFASHRSVDVDLCPCDANDADNHIDNEEKEIHSQSQYLDKD